MTPEETKKLRIAQLAEQIKANKIYLHYPTLPVAFHTNTTQPLPIASIDTIIIIAPTKGSFAHFTDACKKLGWVRPGGIVRQNHIRVEQQVKNHVDNYVICVAKKLPSNYPRRT